MTSAPTKDRTMTRKLIAKALRTTRSMRNNTDDDDEQNHTIANEQKKMGGKLSRLKDSPTRVKMANVAQSMGRKRIEKKKSMKERMNWMRMLRIEKQRKKSKFGFISLPGFGFLSSKISFTSNYKLCRKSVI